MSGMLRDNLQKMIWLKNNRFKNIIGVRGIRSRPSVIVQPSNLSGPPPVLDVGAGDGFFLGILKERKGMAGVGVDLSSEACAKAAKKGLDVRVADLEREPLPFADESFGSVVLLDVLEHFFRPQEVLKEASRVSKEDIIVGVPNFSSLPARVQTFFGRVPENNKPRKGHVYWFTWKELNRQLIEAGFKIEETRFNANFQRLPVVGGIFNALAGMWPSLFALSFVVRARKV